MIGKEVEERITEIVQQANNFNEHSKFEPLFSTDIGKRLGRQADDLLVFVLKGHILAIPFGRITRLSREAMLSSEFDRLLEQAPSDDKERMMIENFREAIRHFSDEQTDEDINRTMYSEQELVWFFMLVTFSLFSYIEVYSEDLVKLLSQNRMVKKKMTDHLIQYSKDRPDKSRPPFTKYKDLTKLSVKNRLIQLEIGLSIDTYLLSVLDHKSLDRHRTRWKKFIKLRNTAAHRDPRVELPREISELVEEVLSDAVLDFSNMESAKAIGPDFTKLVEEVQKQTIDAQKRFQRAIVVFTMALLYPILIDIGLHRYLN